MAYVANNWGPIGTYPSPESTYSGPWLEGSAPAAKTGNNAVNVPIGFQLNNTSAGTFSAASVLAVYVGGSLAILAGAFQTGCTGTITGTGTGVIVVNILTYPSVTTQRVDVVCDVTDSLGNQTQVSFNYNTALGNISGLVAKTWCDGQRIDLLWTLPAFATQVKIRRSLFAFCRYVTDPGEDVYTGAPISAYVDGPGAVPTSYGTGVPQSTTPLQENKFYYYTIFVSFDASNYAWTYNASGQVTGLSIKDYFTLHQNAVGDGNYVYNLLPANYRRKDASTSRGTDQYILRDYCRVMQCGVNIFRGWCEGLLQIKDPDNAPAGRIGEAVNQTGILSAVSWELGIPPEKSFDAGVLRRIALGIFPVMQAKGTCSALVALTKLFTGWDALCDEAIEPVCGVDRLLTTWDSTSKINQFVPTSPTQYVFTPNTATLSIATSEVFMADGVTPDVLPSTTSAQNIVSFIQGSFGDLYCVEAVAAPAGGNQVITLTAAATIPVSLSGACTIGGVPNQVTLASGTLPWPMGQSAFLGYSIKIGGTVYPIVQSYTTDPVAGTTVVNVIGSPSGTTFVLAPAFDVSGNALARLRLYTGEFSFLYDPRFNAADLPDEIVVSQWSVLLGTGGISSAGYAPTPADVTIWASGVYKVLSTITAVQPTTMTDSTKAWTTNQWAGYYVLPNWNQTKIFRITGNTATQLAVDVAEGGGVDTVSADLDYYVILSESDALKYARLVQLMPSFAPYESRIFLKFN